MRIMSRRRCQSVFARCGTDVYALQAVGATVVPAHATRVHTPRASRSPDQSAPPVMEYLNGETLGSGCNAARSPSRKSAKSALRLRPLRRLTGPRPTGLTMCYCSRYLTDALVSSKGTCPLI